jgi:2-C-methyl-D-erythritol 4-phosphate cytidylyltransferase
MYTALIVAAGSGSRTELGYNKVFYEVHSQPIITYSVDRFIADPDFSEIIVVHAKDELEKMKIALKDRQVIFVEGGSTRQESVYRGLKAVTNAVVFIHDGARPNLKKEQLDLLKSGLDNASALTLAVKSKETIKVVRNQQVVGDINRDEAYLIQTPQVFITDEIKSAHEALKSSKIIFTDDTSIYSSYCHGKVYIVEGTDDNVKVTTKFDLMKLEDLI